MKAIGGLISFLVFLVLLRVAFAPVYPLDWDGTENALIEKAYKGELWPFTELP